jgi:hypothetical protein
MEILLPGVDGEKAQAVDALDALAADSLESKNKAKVSKGQWTDDQVKLLKRAAKKVTMDMCLGDKSARWAEIGKRVGRGKKDCYKKYSELKEQKSKRRLQDDLLAAVDTSLGSSINSELGDSSDGFTEAESEQDQPFSMMEQLKKFALSQGKEVEATQLLGDAVPKIDPAVTVGSYTPQYASYTSRTSPTGSSNTKSYVTGSYGTSSSMANERSRFGCGDKVNVQIGSTGHFEAATVQNTNSDGSYTVISDVTGEQQTRVTEEKIIRKQPLEQQEEIRARLRAQAQARLRS